MRKWPEPRNQNKDPAVERHQKEDPRLWNTLVMLKGQEGSAVLLQTQDRLEGGSKGSSWDVALSVVGKLLEELTLSVSHLTHLYLPSWAVGKKT